MTVTQQVANLSPQERRDLLAQLLKEKPKTAPPSFAQERMWFLHQLAPANPSFNMFNAVRLTGQLDVVALGQSLNEIVRRHETLRTTFAAPNGRPVQVIAPALTVRLPLVDLQDIPETGRQALAQRLMMEEADHPFDTARGPLFRASLLRLGEREHIVLLNVHHIVSDGWSQAVLLRELTALYQAFANDQPSRRAGRKQSRQAGRKQSRQAGRKQSPLPELSLQYGELVRWQRQTLTDGVLAQELAYWKRQLAGPLPILELIADGSVSAGSIPKVALQTHTFPQSLTGVLKALSRREGSTLFVTLLAAFKALLYRYTGQTDIVVGSPVANRDRAELEGMIGPLFNTLVLRSDLAGDPTFLELLGRVRQVVLDAFARSSLPFGQLVGELELGRDLNRNPLFQAVFALQETPELALEMPGLSLSLLPTEARMEAEVPVPVAISIQETAGSLVATLQYRTDLLNQKVLAHLQVMLEGIVADPRQRLSALPLLTEAERRQILVTWNDTRTHYPQDRCLHHLFEAQVERAPDAVAVICEDQHLTYRELNRRANQLAFRLQVLGVGPEILVGLCVERSPEMVVGILSVLKAGGAYVPLDPAYPEQRLAFMLKDSGAPVLLTQRHLIAGLPQHQAQVVCLDTDQDALAQERDANPAVGVAPDNLAYVIYTSGSTGQPKGALISHHDVTRLFAATRAWFSFCDQDVWTLFHSYAFDFSVWELWGALLHGGRLVLVPYWVSRTPERFYDLMCAQRVTVLNQTPSAFYQLVRTQEALGADGDLSLRLVIFGGEALALQKLAPWFERHGDQRPQLVNMYGITETTVHVTYRPLTVADLAWGGRSVVGRPILDLQVYVLDQHLQPVPAGVPGEMYVGGDGLGRGYLNRPELAAQRFVANPFTHKPGARLYRTGDLAYYGPGGEIVFLGRTDHQVKVRGFRIELGEIEATLSQLPFVREVVVAARDTERDSPEKQLVAYVVPSDKNEPATSEMRSFLQEKLPEYMVPAAFVILDALPLTPSGKVDRKALPAPDGSATERQKEFVAPETILEQRLAEIWSKVLGVERVSAKDNFFELGGTSLLATEAIYQINKAFQMHLSARDLFQATTVASLALLIEEILIAELEQEEMETQEL